jgi:hypothetical protein
MDKSVRSFSTDCIVPAFLGERFGRKECGLCTYNPPSEEEGGFDEFFNEAAHNF